MDTQAKTTTIAPVKNRHETAADIGTMALEQERALLTVALCSLTEASSTDIDTESYRDDLIKGTIVLIDKCIVKANQSLSMIETCANAKGGE